MAPHSSTLAWKIPWTEEPGRLQSMGSQRVGHLLSDFTINFQLNASEKEMATHSSVLSWRIPGTEEPGGLPSMGSHRVGHDWSNLAAAAAAVPIPGIKPGHLASGVQSLNLWTTREVPWLCFNTSGIRLYLWCQTWFHLIYRNTVASFIHGCTHSPLPFLLWLPVFHFGAVSALLILDAQWGGFRYLILPAIKISITVNSYLPLTFGWVYQ